MQLVQQRSPINHFSLQPIIIHDHAKFFPSSLQQLGWKHYEEKGLEKEETKEETT
jgi:hypothetical protein